MGAILYVKFFLTFIVLGTISLEKELSKYCISLPNHNGLYKCQSLICKLAFDKVGLHCPKLLLYNYLCSSTGAHDINPEDETVNILPH